MSPEISLEKLKHAYCIGIGGIGVSAAAKYLHLSGVKVSGSDAVDSEIVEEVRSLGIATFIGSDTDNIPEKTELVIFSPAVPETHPERVKAREREIPQISYPEFLSVLSKKKYTIAITGTHGKSTTTAMIGLLLKNAGFDPTVIVGSRCKQFSHGNLHMGSSNILVVEACEYQGNMRLLHPNIAVVTNIEWDHPDFYKNADAVYQAMQEFVDGLDPKAGVLIKNFDDTLTRSKLTWSKKTITFGLADGADIEGTDLLINNGTSYFTVALKGKEGYMDERLSVRVPGKFNVSNALAALAVAWEMGVPIDIIRETLASFTGIWRRFERVGDYNGAIVISDYAHHPTAVRATIHAAAEWFPDKRIVVVYQPHQHARTKQLFKEFVGSFHSADVLLLADIYDVKGREENEYQDVSSEKLAEKIKRAEKKKDVQATGDLTNTEIVLRSIVEKDDVVLVMGAGDVDVIARRLVAV